MIENYYMLIANYLYKFVATIITTTMKTATETKMWLISHGYDESKLCKVTGETAQQIRNDFRTSKSTDRLIGKLSRLGIMRKLMAEDYKWKLKVHTLLNTKT